MPQRGAVRSISLLILGVALFVGCSTYEVRDVYVALATETGVFSFKEEHAQFYIQVNPDPRFYSIGIPGVPLIPTYVGGSEPNAIRMNLGLTLRRDRDFSIAQRPCLSVENREPLCASRTGVRTSARYQDDGSAHADKQRRWQSIANFDQLKEWILDLDSQNDGGRVDRKRLYQHYGYVGKPEFGYLQVDVLY